MAKKYLIIQTAFIGDVILATPLIESLKKSDSKNQIDILIKKENSSVLKNNRTINAVFTLDKSKKTQSIISLIKKFRENEYDTVINLHRFASSGIITSLCKAKEKRGIKTGNGQATTKQGPKQHPPPTKTFVPDKIIRKFNLN